MGCWPIRRVFRLVWWLLCLGTFVALPLTIWEFQRQKYDVHYQAWFIGGIFVILSMPISIYEVALHTEYYTRPRLQRHVIRIIWMVPIYAVDAWFALRFRHAREYLDPLRECYEAFVIYNFFMYLMNFLEDELGDVVEYLSKQPQMEHKWGFNWFLKPWDMGTEFLWGCKKGILNYVILRPICTGLAFLTDIFDKYGEGQIDFRKSYVYLAFITSTSQLWALYCLVLLYSCMHQELSPIRPLSKFLCIKAVVFVTFWQGITIAILVWAGVIRRDSWTTYDKLDVAAGIQDFLICIEMFLAALAHAYAFPPRDYMEDNHPTKGFFTNVRYMFDLRDVVIDVGSVVEQHVNSATTTVVKLPKRAVRKAAQGLRDAPQNLRQFFTHRARPGLEEDEDPGGTRCGLLSPNGTPEREQWDPLQEGAMSQELSRTNSSSAASPMAASKRAIVVVEGPTAGIPLPPLTSRLAAALGAVSATARSNSSNSNNGGPGSNSSGSIAPAGPSPEPATLDGEQLEGLPMLPVSRRMHEE